MKLVKIILIVAFLFTGCVTQHYGDFFPFHDDGSLKPKVVLFPIQDGTNANEDLASFFYHSIRWTAMDHGKLFVYSSEEVDHVFKNICTQEPFKRAICFHPADFVVDVEILENSIVPFTQELVDCFIPFPSKSKTVRQVKLRLRIIDIRQEKPKLASFEIIEKCQLIPAKDERQSFTPTIYERLANDIVLRVEEIAGT